MATNPYSPAHYQEAILAAGHATKAADDAHGVLTAARAKLAKAIECGWDTAPAYQTDVDLAKASFVDLQAKADADDEALRRLQEALSLEEQEAFTNQP